MAVAAFRIPPGAELCQIGTRKLILGLHVQRAAEQEASRNVVQMNSEDALRMIESKRDRNARSPVAALRAEAFIAEFSHQSRPESRSLVRFHSSYARTIGESIAWQ